MWYSIQSIPGATPYLDTLLAAMDAGSVPATLLIDREVRVAPPTIDKPSCVVPPGIDLVFSRGGRVVGGDGVLELPAAPRAGLYPIFGHPLTPQETTPKVRFRGWNAGIRPEWWGLAGTSEDNKKAVGDRNTRALQDALDSAARDGGQVELCPGQFYVDAPLRVPSNVGISGVPGSTRLVFTCEEALVLAPEARHVRLYGLQLKRHVEGIGTGTAITMTSGSKLDVEAVTVFRFGTAVRQTSSVGERFQGLRFRQSAFLQCGQGVWADLVDDVLLERCRCSPEAEFPAPVRGHSFGKAGSTPCRNIVLRDCAFEMWKDWAVRAVNVDGLRMEGIYAEVYYNAIPLKVDRPFFVVEKGGLSGDGAWMGLNYFNQSLADQAEPSDVVVFRDPDPRLPDRMRFADYTIEGMGTGVPPVDNEASTVNKQAFFIRPGTFVYRRPAGIKGEGALGWVSDGYKYPPPKDFPEWNWLLVDGIDASDATPAGWVPFCTLDEEVTP